MTPPGEPTRPHWPVNDKRHSICQHRKTRSGAVPWGGASAHQQAAGDVHHGAGDVGGAAGGEEDGGRGHLLHLRQAAQGHARQVALGVGGELLLHHVREHEPGGHRVDGHPQRRRLARQRDGERDEAALGGVVGHLPAGAAVEGGGGGHVHDPAGEAGGAEAAQQLAAAEEGPGEVHREHLLPARPLHGHRRAARADGAVVDEDGHRAEPRRGGVEGGHHLRLRRGVEAQRESVPGAGGEAGPGRRPGRLLAGPVAEDHLRPLRRQPQGDGAAQATRGPRHQRHPIAQAQVHPCLPSAAWPRRLPSRRAAASPRCSRARG